MADYGFVHEGRVFMPNGTIGVEASENDARNRAIEAGELDAWQGQPESFVAYYAFPEGADVRVNRFAELRRQPYEINCWGTSRETAAKVTTWRGTKIGTIVRAKVYRHNLGGRFVSMHVKGTNGAEYYGRASYDNGTVVRLRRCKAGK